MVAAKLGTGRPKRVLAAIVMAAGLAACGKSAPPAPAATPVLTLQVQADGLQAGSAYPAQLQARHSADLSFRVGGKLALRYVHVGDRVRKGQVLATLDAADASAQLAAARAAREAAEHRLLFARQQLQRDQAQMQQDLIARAQLEQSQDNFAAAQAAARQAAEQMQLAGNQLGYHALRADHDGVITAENGEVGTVVAAGSPVYTLAWTPDLDVWVDVSTGDKAQWQPGSRARVRVTELPGVTLMARVREMADTEDSVSGSYRVKLTVEGGDPRVRPGMSATAEPLAGSAVGAGGVLIPSTALFHDREQPAVWVIRPDRSTLVLRPVTVGGYRASQVLIAGGLRPGERIVAAGVHNVYPGQKVRVADAPAAVLNSGRAQVQP